MSHQQKWQSWEKFKLNSQLNQDLWDFLSGHPDHQHSVPQLQPSVYKLKHASPVIIIITQIFLSHCIGQAVLAGQDNILCLASEMRWRFSISSAARVIMLCPSLETGIATTLHHWLSGRILWVHPEGTHDMQVNKWSLHSVRVSINFFVFPIIWGITQHHLGPKVEEIKNG